MTSNDSNQNPQTSGNGKPRHNYTPVYLRVMDIIRFFLAWAAITFLWIVIYGGHSHTTGEEGHGDITPYIIGFLGAIFYQGVRMYWRKKELSDKQKQTGSD